MGRAISVSGPPLPSTAPSGSVSVAVTGIRGTPVVLSGPSGPTPVGVPGHAIGTSFIATEVATPLGLCREPIILDRFLVAPERKRRLRLEVARPFLVARGYRQQIPVVYGVTVS